MWRWYKRRQRWCHRICPKRKGHKKAVRVKVKDVDIEATKARNFSHPRSRVMQDGREILFDSDYNKRVFEVESRDKFKCQWFVLRNVADPFFDENTPDESTYPCGKPSNGHPHHRIKRSQGRDDRSSNLMAICDEHHKLTHPEFRVRWSSGEKSS